MPLDYSVKSLDGLDEAVAGLYVESQSGGFHLDVTGAVAKSRLDEFRDKNIALTKAAESFKDIDPKKYKQFQADSEKLQQYQADGKKPMGDSELETIISNRVSEMQGEYETRIGEVSSERDGLRSQLQNQTLEVAISKAIASTGARASAITDLAFRAQQAFSFENGIPVIKDNQGEIIYDKSGTAPLNVEGWMKQLKTSGNADHLFEMPSGSGANGSGKGRTDFSKMSSVQKIEHALSNR